MLGLYIVPCPSHLCLAVCKNVGNTTVEHDFFTTCYERPPVLRDRFCWAEGVVAQDRFYCTVNLNYCYLLLYGNYVPILNTVLLVNNK